MKPSRLLCVLIVALVVAAFAACQGRRGPPVFPHVAHLTLEDCGGPGQAPCLNCASCHASQIAAAPPPTLRVVDCRECHEARQQRAAFGSIAAAARRGIRFDHTPHLELAEISGQCVRCHGGVADSSQETMPKMEVCLECHEAEFQQARCTPCHDAAHLPSLVPKSFMRHDAAWGRSHALPASRAPMICGECHSETWCSDCHDANRGLSPELREPEAIERGHVHRGDFMVRHAIEARQDGVRCLSCHSPPSCDGCHVERGVSAARVGAQSPHAPGWVGGSASKASHGRAARRDLVTCMACHDQGPATNCIQCHRVGGTGGNPHPSGWDSDRSTSHGMCRYCHVD